MENTESGLAKLTDSLEIAISGIPAPVRKNFLKAFGQLCTAAIDIPVAMMEGKSAEIRALSEARVQIIKKEGESISEKIEVPQEYISKASNKYAAKIINEQINLDEITLNAAHDIASKEITEESSDKSEIADDWLNEFESSARLKSSEDMKLIFGKLLSGEIIKPGTFSIRTIRLISQLDNQAAKLFQILCSRTVSLNIANEVFDARVVSFSGNAASNSLAKFGLSFDYLNILHEYGLIISEYNSNMGYGTSIVKRGNVVPIPLIYNNKKYGLIPTDNEKYDKVLKLSGVALTKSGKELLSIIPIAKDDSYTDELLAFFESKHLKMVEIGSPS